MTPPNQPPTSTPAQKPMSTTAKVFILGLTLCILGAVELDLRVNWTGGTCLSIGGIILVLAPLIAEQINAK